MQLAYTSVAFLYGGLALAIATVTWFVARRINEKPTTTLRVLSGKRLFALGFGAWVVALAFGLYQDARYAQALAKQSICKGHMKAWALALHNYHSDHGHFPASTLNTQNHQHSWRILVAPYLEADRIRDHYDFGSPWNAPQNLKLTSDVDRYFHCPDHSLSDDITKTSYVIITGPNCVIRDDGYTPRQFEDLDPEAVLFVETTNTNIHWMEPADLFYEELIADREYAESVLGGPHPSGGYYATVDGQIKTIASIGIEELLRRCIVDDSTND